MSKNLSFSVRKFRGKKRTSGCFDIDLFSDVYNVLLIDFLLSLQTFPDSLDKFKDYEDKIAYQIGGKTLTLSAIENGILRGIYSFFIKNIHHIFYFKETNPTSKPEKSISMKKKRKFGHYP